MIFDEILSSKSDTRGRGLSVSKNYFEFTVFSFINRSDKIKLFFIKNQDISTEARFLIISPI